MTTDISTKNAKKVICPTCNGDGMVLVKSLTRGDHVEPCPECQGVCVVYCCEGAPVGAANSEGK